ncbi:MAG: hypothetical protein AAFY36_19485, partial [Bacteroidota bacterium]
EIDSVGGVTFRNFGRVHSDKQFDIYVLLRERNGVGRDYTFVVRTFDENFKVIDSYELASWIDAENQYCFGSINADLIIKKSCDNGEVKDVKQIVNGGRIVATSFHGRE